MTTRFVLDVRCNTEGCDARYIAELSEPPRDGWLRTREHGEPSRWHTGGQDYCPDHAHVERVSA